MSKMKFLEYFCLSLALATTALARRDRNAMAMATLEKLESLLSEEMALEQAHEQELAEEQAYEQELAEEKVFQQELAEEEVFQQELERQNLIAALQSACGRGSGAHVQTLSALADLLSTGEVTAQEAMNYLKAQGLDKHIARIEGGGNEESLVSMLQALLSELEKALEKINSDIAAEEAKGKTGADVSELKNLRTIFKDTRDKVAALIKNAGAGGGDSGGGAGSIKQQITEFVDERSKVFNDKIKAIKKKKVDAGEDTRNHLVSQMWREFELYATNIAERLTKLKEHHGKKPPDDKDPSQGATPLFIRKLLLLLRALATRAKEQVY